MPESVLAGIELRSAPLVEVLPRSSPRIISVTFRLDDVAVNHARGRALLEGTSVNALIARFVSEYSGIVVPPAPSPQPALPRVRMTDNSYR